MASNLKKNLQAVSNDIKKLSQKIEKLVAAMDEPAKSKPVKAKSVKKATAKKMRTAQKNVVKAKKKTAAKNDQK